MVTTPIRLLLSTALLTISLSARAEEPGAEAPASVNPSRPTQTNSPDIGPPGYVEADVGAMVGDGVVGTPVLLKHALNENFEVRLGFEGVTAERAVGEWSRSYDAISGWVQWIPKPVDEGFRWAVAAGAAGSLGHADGTAGQLQLAGALPFGDFRVDSNLNLVATRGGGDTLWAAGATAILARSFDDLTVFAELGAVQALEAGADLELTWLAGVSYAIGPRAVLDLAAQAPTSAPGELLVHAGISFLVGR